ncbi:hypothetical protein SEVIR_4G277300v4 [Setaria viridis]|uniref:Uncharacterized protein n=1 Tax=Setaria viridis TaxID=4556 RepID=A0A4U6V299_SETVI|nr:uncharacterized protein LOC117852589 isoform X2 [Setaria viridis]XP_034590629.1 uncharacterized protein LOC117852589 isoform X2 [Setaria viridis]TKW23190.1 hypothetical protein SEVIR_4G277300v2 [Setaria viridis]
MATDMAVDLEKGTEETMGALDAQLPVPAMAGGGEKELLSGDLRRLLPAKHMPDLEKGMDTHAGQVQAMAEDEEQEHLILKDLRYHQVEGGAVAGKMNPCKKKWLPYYWLLVAAASVIVLNNHIHAAPKDQLFPPELAMFTVLLCAICLILLSMKQMV